MRDTCTTYVREGDKSSYASTCTCGAFFLGGSGAYTAHVIKWVVVVVERGWGEVDGGNSGLELSGERGVRKKTRERERETDRQTDRGRQRQTETERDRDRKRHRETETHTERQRN